MHSFSAVLEPRSGGKSSDNSVLLASDKVMLKFQDAKPTCHSDKNAEWNRDYLPRYRWNEIDQLTAKRPSNENSAPEQKQF